MKKLAFLFAAAALFAACSGNKQQNAENNEAIPAQEESFELKQVKAGMSVRLDSLTEALMRVKPFGIFYKGEDGKIALTDDEKKVKPDYLMDPATLASKLDNLSMKYRALVVYQNDQVVANAYEMEDVYSEPLAKLTAEVNDPAQKYIMEHLGEETIMQEAYKIAEANGRANYMWQAVATAIIENLYIINQNQEKFLASFTDKDAEDVTFQVVCLVEAYEELAELDTEFQKLYNVLLPLEKIDAISVAQLRDQLNSLKVEVEQARATLFL